MLGVLADALASGWKKLKRIASGIVKRRSSKRKHVSVVPAEGIVLEHTKFHSRRKVCIICIYICGVLLIFFFFSQFVCSVCVCICLCEQKVEHSVIYIIWYMIYM